MLDLGSVLTHFEVSQLAKCSACRHVCVCMWFSVGGEFATGDVSNVQRHLLVVTAGI